MGPTLSAVYYDRSSNHALPSYAPRADDDRIAPLLNATLVIDDAGTTEPGDDRLSGTLEIGPAARSLVARPVIGGKIFRLVESWTRIVHTLASTPISAARRLANGDIEYVISERGFPSRLCRKEAAQDCFPSAAAPDMTLGKWAVDSWSAPAKVGVARSLALGGNAGARTTATAENYLCTDAANGVDCSHGLGVWGATADGFGLDNLLLKITTDRRRRIRAVEGFWTHEYRIDAGPAAAQAPAGQNNTWWGGVLQLTPVP